MNVGKKNWAQSYIARDKKKLLIMGHARHGKDTVAEILRDDYGYKFNSSSVTALNKSIWPMLKNFYKDELECFNDRVNNRALWAALIRDYNRVDKSRLCRDILKESDIYVGMRMLSEFDHCATQFDHVIWVEASDRHELEPEDSFNITLEYVKKKCINISYNRDFISRHHRVYQIDLNDYFMLNILNNNGSEEELKENVKNMVEDFNKEYYGRQV